MKNLPFKLVHLGGAKLSFSETASIAVDPQCGFSELCPNELPVPGALEIVEELNGQAFCTALKVASKDAHPANPLWIASNEKPQFSVIEGQKDLDIRWNLHCVPGTKGFEFLPGLEDNYDFVAYKGIAPNQHPYGACYHDLADTVSTGLIEYLRYNQIENVIVGGLATSFCVRKTVLQLCHYGEFQVFVNITACRDIADIDTQVAIDEMEEAGAIMVTTSEIEHAFVS